MSRSLGVMSKGSCPRCGAVPSQQKWKPRVNVRDFAKYELIGSFNPVDAVWCPSCKMVFQVSKIECDGTFVVDWDTKYEYVPNYCPQCGKRIRLLGESE